MVAPPAVSVALDADYDADALALADGDPVGTWTPTTGTAAALLQATAGSQPTYRTSVLATGHAGVELDGSSDFMVADYDQQMPWSAAAIFVTDANDGVIFGSTNNSFKGGLFLDAGQLAYESHGSDLFDGAVSTGAAHVGVGVWNFTDASVRLDGAAPQLGDAGTRQRLGLKLGNEEADLNREPFTGTILRLLFFAGGLTEADIVTLDTWAQDTYGIPVADYTGGGAPPAEGQASGFLGFTATATGARASRGGFTDTLTHSGATGTHRASQGMFAGALAWLGQAVGRRRSTGTASGTLDHTGTATGDAPVVGSASGAFGGGITWGGTATGRRRSTGTFAGALARTATTTGRRASRGGPAGLLTWLGGFVGIGGNVPARDLTIIEATLPTSEWATEQPTGAWATTPTENRWTHTTPTSSWTTTGATP